MEKLPSVLVASLTLEEWFAALDIPKPVLRYTRYLELTVCHGRFGGQNDQVGRALQLISRLHQLFPRLETLEVHFVSSALTTYKQVSAPRQRYVLWFPGYREAARTGVGSVIEALVRSSIRNVIAHVEAVGAEIQDGSGMTIDEMTETLLTKQQQLRLR